MHDPFPSAAPVAREAVTRRVHDGLQRPYAGAKFPACEKFYAHMREQNFSHVKKLSPTCEKQTPFAGTAAPSGKTDRHTVAGRHPLPCRSHFIFKRVLNMVFTNKKSRSDEI